MILKRIIFVVFIMISFNDKLLADDANCYYTKWADKASYNTQITVLDTDSALGRYSTHLKKIGIKDIIQYHGHLCDGMVIAYIELSATLNLLFPDSKIDRTDLRVVSKNGPCWVDTATYMTGARINFKTLSIDNSTGNGFIVQKISTGETYDVHLKPSIFPQKMEKLEKEIKQSHFNGQEVNPKDIDKLEKMAGNLIKKLLNSPPKELLDIKKLKNYNFKFLFKPGIRTDVINKNVVRK